MDGTAGASAPHVAPGEARLNPAPDHTPPLPGDVHAPITRIIAEVAATGVDYISVGALTHSVAILDIGLDADPNQAPSRASSAVFTSGHSVSKME